MKPLKQPHVRTAMFLIVFGVFVYSVFDRPGSYASALTWLWNVLSVVVWGFALAFLLNLIMAPIEKLILHIGSHRKRPFKPKPVRGVSAVITVIITLGVVALMLGTIIPAVIDIVQTVIDILPTATESVSTWITDTLPRIMPDVKDSTELGSRISQLLTDSTSSIVTYLTGLVSSYATLALELTAGIVGSLANIVLTVAMALYVLTGKEQVIAAFRTLAEAYLPDRIKRFCFDTVRLANEKFSLFFRGQIIEAVILGTLCFIGMLIFRFPNPGLISILMAVTSIVPVAGPWTGSITSILLVVINNPLTGLFFGIYILVLQEVEDNVIYPRVVGSSMGLPGVLVLFSVIAGVKAAGMLGIIIGVPLCAVVYELVRTYAGARIARKEQTDAHTD